MHASSCAVPPSTTAPPTELSATNIPVCCAGVQLNLANPADLTDARVLVDNTLHPPNQVMKNGSFLYIMGLQAGTEYSLNITLSNIFGTVWVNTTVRTLLGELVLTCSIVSQGLFVWVRKNVCSHSTWEESVPLSFPSPPPPQAVPPPHKWPSPPLLVD